MPAALQFFVVDPLEGVQVFARRLFEGYGFAPDSIHCFSDTGSALIQAMDTPPDFLITDWFGKADMTGVQLYQHIKAQHPTCHVGFMSFDVGPEVEAAARAAGSRFLLKKPFTAEELKRTTQANLEWLSRERPELAARLNAESKGKLDVRQQRRIELPPVPPPIRVGDSVRFDGKPHKVVTVVISRGEQMAQLHGVKDLVPAHKLQR
ncbi:response regulator [Inhella crocodyli]|uniref:Response regulator n=1 Tax=Inhella crocodyli TaxID=2499851 RepID=A0A437LKX8_9BURK|nr:response regulator [Inhella crocodyli]RVT86056.1 response regulator [Inhella crocodyli]